MLSPSPHFYYLKNTTQNPVLKILSKKSQRSMLTCPCNTSKLIIKESKCTNALFNDPHNFCRKPISCRITSNYMSNFGGIGNLNATTK